MEAPVSFCFEACLYLLNAKNNAKTALSRPASKQQETIDAVDNLLFFQFAF